MTFLNKKNTLFCLLTGFFLATSCRAPDPNNEEIRIPQIMDGVIYAKEGKFYTTQLAPYIPEPEYKADRLNPNRYDQSELSFSCVHGCPEGFNIDKQTGVITWTPTHQDSGVHFITLVTHSGIYHLEKKVPFFVEETDLPPLVPDKPIVIRGKEGKKIGHEIEFKDPDNDPIQVGCIEGCKNGLLINKNTGSISWTPGYDDAGEHLVRVSVKSTSNYRDLPIRNKPPEIPLQEVLDEMERGVLHRTKVQSVVASIKFIIENSDRKPVIPTENSLYTAKEMELFSTHFKIEDPDGDKVTYKCKSDCPPGFKVNETSGITTWTPNYDQAGNYTFGIDVYSNNEHVGVIPMRIEVANTNRQPFFSNLQKTFELKEGVFFNYAIPGIDPDKEDTLIYSCESSCPEGLTVSPNGLMVWTPNYDQSGNYTPTLKVSDGEFSVTATVAIVVEHVNRAPYFVAPPTKLEIPAAFAMQYNLTGKDDDVEDEGKLRYSCIVDCPEGFTVNIANGQITWFPTYAQFGNYAVTVGVTDGKLSKNIIIIFEVVRTDRSPKFTNLIAVQGEELQLLNFTLQATDADGDEITYSCRDDCPEGMTLNPSTGEVNWTPNAQQAGTYAVVFRASSSPVWDENVVKHTDVVANIFIKNFNRAPTINPLSNIEVFEGGHLNSDYLSETGHGVHFQIEAEDIDGDTLTYLCSANCPPGLNVNPLTGKVDWTPAYTHAKPFNAPYIGVEFAVTDGEIMVRAPVIEILVKDVNRPAQIAKLSDIEVFENGHLNENETSVTGQSVAFYINATDLDQDLLFYSCYENCPEGLTVHPISGYVTWTPSYLQAKSGNAPYEDIVFSVDDGKFVSYSNKINIIVKNVNRAPRFDSLPSSFSVFENGHENADETSPTNSPLSFVLNAYDPDGEDLTISCSTGCPAGLNVNSTTGDISWRPAYCSDFEPTCTPKESGNVGARKNNAPYGPMIFQISDGDKTVFTSPLLIYVINVDRKAVLSEPSQLTVSENDFTSYNIGAVDPDGDPISYKCLGVLISSTGIEEPCKSSGGTHSFPQMVGSQNFGRTSFFNLRTTTGEVSIGTPTKPVGYFDAQKFNQPYIAKYEISSATPFFPDLPKKVQATQEITIVNVDRGAELYAAGPFTVEDGNAVTETGAIEFGLSIGLAMDPDAQWDEFRDTVEFYCDPSGPDGCPEGLTIQQNCNLTCKYDDSPNGCESGSWEEKYMKCALKGRVNFKTGYGHAKFGNAPYVIRFVAKSSVHPDDFDLNEYPPIENSVDVSIAVVNKDRPPVMEELFSNVSVREPCGDAPLGVYPHPDGCSHGEGGGGDFAIEIPHGDFDEKSYTLVASDPDEEFSTPENPTEGNIEFILLGCSNSDANVFPNEGVCPANLPINTPSGCLASCPHFINISGNTVTVKPTTYSDALPAEALRVARFQALGCPLEATGWECAAPKVDSIHKMYVHVKNQDRKPAMVTLTPGIGYTKDPNQVVNVTEMEDYKYEIHSSDPDGDQIVFCVEGNINNLTPVPEDGKTLVSVNSLQDGVMTSYSEVSMNIDPLGYKRVNRMTTGLAQSYKIRACSASTEFLPFMPPSCSSSTADIRCSEPSNIGSPENPNTGDGWRDFTMRFYDIDRPPTFSVEAYSAGYYETEVIVLETHKNDPDSDYDQIKVCPTNTGAVADTTGNSANSINHENCASSAELDKPNVTYSAGYNVVTRQNPTRAFRPDFHVCYENGPTSIPLDFPADMPKPPLMGTCYGVKKLDTPGIVIKNKDRLPYFVTAPKIYEYGPVKVYTPYTWEDPLTGTFSLNYSFAEKSPSQYSYLQSLARYIYPHHSSPMVEGYTGGTSKGHVAEYDGTFEVAGKITDEDIDDLSDIEIRFCNTTGERLDVLGSNSSYTGSIETVNGYKGESGIFGIAKWNIDHDLISGIGRPNSINFNPCLKVCYKNEGCSDLPIINADGKERRKTLSIEIKDSDRPPRPSNEKFRKISYSHWDAIPQWGNYWHHTSDFAHWYDVQVEGLYPIPFEYSCPYMGGVKRAYYETELKKAIKLYYNTFGYYWDADGDPIEDVELELLSSGVLIRWTGEGEGCMSHYYFRLISRGNKEMIKSYINGFHLWHGWHTRGSNICVVGGGHTCTYEDPETGLMVTY